MLLTELYAARQEEDKLLDVVRALRQGFPSNADVLYMAYRLYSDLGARAISDLVREAPGSARVHQVTADLLLSEGDYPRAARQYREALRIDERLPGANRALAVAILNSNPDEAGMQEAEQALGRELSLNPRDAESLYQLGEISWRKGAEDAALKHYAAAVELQPKFVEGADRARKSVHSQSRIRPGSAASRGSCANRCGERSGALPAGPSLSKPRPDRRGRQ